MSPPSDIPPALSPPNAGRAPLLLGFLLTDDFAMMSYASVIEPFRAANILSGEMLYSWRHFSPSGAPARASSDVSIAVDGKLASAGALDLLFVCAGGNPARFAHAETFGALRRLAAHGALLAGVSGGPFLLARAGLLEGHRCTIHWEHEAAFVEAFPNVEAERGLYVIDRGRLSCAGGTAGLDLAIDLITQAHGAELGLRVSDWFIRTEQRSGGGEQRGSLTQRYRVHHRALIAALGAMEDNISDPLSREALAKRAGTSVRHLERLFAQQLRTSLRSQYLRIRLDAAMRLLRETDLPRIEVAMACGFVSASHFSRAFKARFHKSALGARHESRRSD